jgi:hypothetical protein
LLPLSAFLGFPVLAFALRMFTEVNSAGIRRTFCCDNSRFIFAAAAMSSVCNDYAQKLSATARNLPQTICRVFGSAQNLCRVVGPSFGATSLGLPRCNHPILLITVPLRKRRKPKRQNAKSRNAKTPKRRNAGMPGCEACTQGVARSVYPRLRLGLVWLVNSTGGRAASGTMRRMRLGRVGRAD